VIYSVDVKFRICWRTLIWLVVLALVTLPADSRPYVARIAQGDALRQQAEYRRALVAYSAAAALYSNSSAVTQRSAETCLEWGRPDQAVEWFRRAQRQDPSRSGILIGWGQAYADLGDEARARQIWEQATAIAEVTGVAHHRLGRLDLERGDFPTAQIHFEASLKGVLPDGDAQSARFWVALLHGLDRPADALTDLRRAIEGPDPATASEAQSVAAALEQVKLESPHTAMGAALAGLRRWSIARAYLERALATDPNDVTAMAYLGACLDGQGKTVEAAARLRAALVAQPDAILTLFLWGRHLALSGQTRPARYAFERVLALDPTNAAACAEIARTFINERDYGPAESWFEQAISRAPDQVEFFLLLAEFESDTLLNVAKGATAAKRAAELQPANPTAVDALGWAQVLSGQWDDAERTLHRAAELAPRWADPYAHLGRLYDRQGRAESARWAFGRVLDLARTEPLQTEANDALRRLGPNVEVNSGSTF
jgi:tetratricopeptide (TPR) repeat protein